jgi:Rod binding domain-containing protein
MISPATLAVTPPASKPEIAGPQLEKLRKGAREFESMLVEQIWKGMKSESDDSGSGQTLSDMGSHAFAAGIAARGGFGIAKMILHQLAPSAESSPEGGTKTLKVTRLKDAKTSADLQSGDKQ